jgi:hypothetical protein
MGPEKASHDVRNITVLAALLVVFISPAASTATCYRTNGVAGTDDIQPCHKNLARGAQSACCNLGKSPPDLCLAGGLCYRRDGYDGNALIYAVGCMDQLGTDMACQQYCYSDAEIEMYSLNACNDGPWCCNNITLSESCCDPVTGSGAFALDHVLSLDPALSDVTQTAESTVTITKTATPLVSCTSNTSNTTQSNAIACSSNTTVIAGASVGAAIAGVLVTTVLALCFMTRLKRSHRQQIAQIQPSTIPTDSSGPASGWRHEMDTKRHRPETVREIPPVVAYEIDGGGRAELR